MKSVVKVLRVSPPISNLLYTIARPIHAIGATLQSRAARHVLRNGGTAIYDGIPLEFPSNVGIGFLSSISWRGLEGFEPETWLTLKTLIGRSATFFDVGANIGFYSVLAKRLAPDLEVVSFEPVPDVARQNRTFHSANRVTTSLHEIALSDRDGEEILFQPDEEESTASTLTPESWQARKNHKKITVPTARLDTLLGTRVLQAPITIKIDVEDHEAAVLRGAINTIRRYKPAIVCEILPRPQRADGRLGSEILLPGEQHENAATLKVLSEVGYVAFAITSEGYFRMTAADFKSDRNFRDFLLIPQNEGDAGRNYFRDVSECSWMRESK